MRHSLLSAPLAIFGFYDSANADGNSDGVAQMMNAGKGASELHTNRSLGRVYMLGGVNPNTMKPPLKATSGSLDILRVTTGGAAYTTLLSGAGSSSGYREQLSGPAPATLDKWTGARSTSNTTTATTAATTTSASSWSTSSLITPNNHNFPASGLKAGQPNLPTADLAALLTGVYGSAPGCLCTFPGGGGSCPGLKDGDHVGQIATTVARPSRGYGGTYNYFDPDNFFSMTALIYSGDPFLQEQARMVIERSGSFLCLGEVAKQNKCTYGQLPHHFVGTKPTFLALSGATQTGPNTFWTKSALQYARNSGNLPWLKKYMPTLRAAAAFCFDLINKVHIQLRVFSTGDRLCTWTDSCPLPRVNVHCHVSIRPQYILSALETDRSHRCSIDKKRITTCCWRRAH